MSISVTNLKTNELSETINYIGSTNDLIFNPVGMDSMMKLAEIMASSTVTVPKHLQGKTGDCFALVMQSAQWGMNPFVVSQKTHIVNGTLGYEAQLVNALVMASGAITPPFIYEYKGENESLECRVGAVPKGKTEVLWGEWLKSSQVTIKNSPLWKTNPRQQLGYLQVKNWARAYYPGAILGVYTTDELETIDQPIEKEINPKTNVISAEQLITNINTMTIAQLSPDALKSLDIKPYTADEVTAIKAAITARRKATKEQAVVATVKNDDQDELLDMLDKIETPLSSEKKTKSNKADRDWKQEIKECGDKGSLDTLLKEMPQAVSDELFDFISDQYDLISSISNLP